VKLVPLVTSEDSGVGVGVSAVVVVELIADSGVAVGLVAGATVSVFCSQATSSAAPARMEMYFFIRHKVPLMTDRSKRTLRLWKLSELKRRFVFQAMCFGHGLTSELAIERVDSSRERRLLETRFFQSAIGQHLYVAVSDIRKRLRRGP
jgi:hypothetical protein